MLQSIFRNSINNCLCLSDLQVDRFFGWLLLWAFLIVPKFNPAQGPVPIVNTAKTYFRQNEVRPFDIEVDPKGYVYMASFSGIHVFDGHKMKQIPIHESQNREVWEAIYKGPKGELWFKSIAGHLALIESGQAIPHPKSDSLLHLTKGALENLYCDAAGRLHIAPRGKGYFIVHPSGDIDEIMGVSSGYNGYMITHLEDGTPFHFSIYNEPTTEEVNFLSIFYLPAGGSPYLLEDKALTKSYRESTLIEHKDGTMTLATGNDVILKLNNERILLRKKLPYSIIKIFEDSRSTLWIGTMKGIYKANDKDLDELIFFLEGSPSAVVAEDPEGGLWLKSQDHHFGHISYPQADHFPFETPASGYFTTCLSTDFTRVYAMIDNSRVAVIEGDSTSFLPDLPSPGNSSSFSDQPIKLHYDTINQVLWAGYRFNLAKWDGKTWEQIQIDDPGFARRGLANFTIDQNGKLYGLSGNRFFTVSENNEIIFSEKTEEFNLCLQIAVDPQGVVWLGTREGLWIYENGYLSRPEMIPAELQANTVTALAVVQGHICFHIDYFGMFAIINGVLTPLRNQQNQKLECDNWFIDASGALWAVEFGIFGAINHINFEEDKVAIKQFFEFRNSIGVHFRDNSMVVNKGQVFLGNKQGVYRQDLAKLHPTPLPANPVFSYFRVNHHAHALSPQNWLEPDQNTISIGFDLISTKMRPITYSTRVLGLDAVWRESEHNEVVYTNLDPGDYTFQLRAKTKGDDWGKVREIAFTIVTPFYETWWFRTLGVLSLMGLGAGGWALRWRVRKRQTQLEIEKLKAEQTALKAQMNPHFMFNALGSIQDLVYNQSKILALKNIALFSRLMRQILEYSSEELISLEEEVEILSNYLKLESLRFEGDFDFNFHIVPPVNLQKCVIPPLLLQPFAENSVKHGLLNKTPRGGTVSIDFEMEGKYLKCTVTDDGIGRKAAAKNQTRHQETHRSFGSDAVYRRIEVLNAHKKEKITLNILDLWDENAKAAGTKVILVIPQPHLP